MKDKERVCEKECEIGFEKGKRKAEIKRSKWEEKGLGMRNEISQN